MTLLTVQSGFQEQQGDPWWFMMLLTEQSSFQEQHVDFMVVYDVAHGTEWLSGTTRWSMVVYDVAHRTEWLSGTTCWFYGRLWRCSRNRVAFRNNMLILWSFMTLLTEQSGFQEQQGDPWWFMMLLTEQSGFQEQHVDFMVVYDVAHGTEWLSGTTCWFYGRLWRCSRNRVAFRNNKVIHGGLWCCSQNRVAFRNNMLILWSFMTLLTEQSGFQEQHVDFMVVYDVAHGTEWLSGTTWWSMVVYDVAQSTEWLSGITWCFMVVYDVAHNRVAFRNNWSMVVYDIAHNRAAFRKNMVIYGGLWHCTQ